MMVRISALFNFSRSEVAHLYSKAKLKKKSLGLKLLQAPLSILNSIPDQTIPNAPILTDQNASFEDPHVQHGKLLVVIPKKFGNACARNRFRRQVKAIFYESKLYLHPIESVLIVYAQAKALSFDQIKEFLNTNIPPKD